MAPILLLIFYTFSSMICWIVCVCLLILNMIITGIIVDENEFNTQFIHEKNWEGDWFNKVYGKPYTRLAPYVIGLLCGLIYVEYHREHSRDKLSKNISNFITRSSMHSTATFVIGAILTWFIVYIQQEPYAKMG